ncbi:MAG: GDP-mannose 4,6-dehydratase [Syntrophobacteraceae bacterium]
MPFQSKQKALIVGVAGQDGFYLSRLLADKGYWIYGADRYVASMDAEQKELLSGIAHIELSQHGKLVEYINEIMPDEIYYLAAHHFSSRGDENRLGRLSPFLSVNLVTPCEVLETMQAQLPRSRFFYAASSHIFGLPDHSPQDETTPYRPVTPYAISKTSAIYMCRYFRESHGIHTVVGILYNHESPRRSEEFVTSQIARAAAMASRGSDNPLVLRDLQAVVDWGAAEDYVAAMWLALQQPSGDEYIISSGIPRTVMDFAREAFGVVGLDAERYVFQGSETTAVTHKYYVGDSGKIRRMCGWRPAKTFESLVKDMVEVQLSRVRED